MSREHAEHIRAWIARWEAATPDARRAELARLDANGYADARVEAAKHGFSNFGVASLEEIPAAITVTEPPKEAIASFEATPAPLVAYTDGSGTIATKPCGAGVVVYDGDDVVLEVSRHLGNGTNNRAELCGIGLALAVTDEPSMRVRALVIRSDSTYAIGAISAAHGPWDGAANAKLIRYVRSLLVGRSATFEHVRGHAGVAGNERADKLAGLARLRIPRAVTDTRETLRRAG